MRDREEEELELVRVERTSTWTCFSSAFVGKPTPRVRFAPPTMSTGETGSKLWSSREDDFDMADLKDSAEVRVFLRMPCGKAGGLT